MSSTSPQRVYAWRKGFPAPSIEAQVFGEIKEKIEATKGDVVLAEDILDAARDPSSPIRAALEWDDSKAAHAHRLDQARDLLGGLHIVRVVTESQPNISTKAMFVVNHAGQRGYVSEHRIIGDRELKKQVIASARRELECFIRKYSSVLAMGTFIPRLQDVVGAMVSEVERLEADAMAKRAPPKAKAPAVSEEARL